MLRPRKDHLRLKRWIALVALVLMANACDESPTAPDVPFRRIARGSGGPAGESRQVLVVRDRASWAALLAQLRPIDPPGAINFSAEMVIGVFLVTGSVCEQVTVDRVTRRGDTLQIAAVHERPCGVCVGLWFGPPFEVIAVPRSDRRVEAEWSVRRILPCT